MKQVLLIVLILAGFCLAQNWEVVKMGDVEYYPNAGKFIDDMTGYFVGDDGVVFGTVDGGANGITVREPDGSGIDWEDIKFANDTVAYVCASDGFIFKTTDGCATWEMIGDTANYTEDLKNVAVVSEDLVYIAGRKSTLLKTVDGGENWTASEFDFGEDLDGGIAFINADTGVVVTDANKGLTWHTHDGGETWTQTTITFPGGTASSRLYDVSAGESNFIVAGYHYTIFASTDFGVSYSLISPYSFGFDQMKQVQALDDNMIVGSGSDGFAVKTTDGGATWDTLNTVSGQSLAFFDFPSTDVGYFFQYYGQWTKTADGGDTFSPILDWPSISFWGLAFPTTDKIVVAAWGGGELTMSVDGGGTWTYPDNYSTGTVVSLYECEFVDENTGLVAGSYGQVRKTTDGGASFNLVDNPMYQGTNLHVNAMHVGASGKVYAGGSKGNIMVSADNGDTWTALENDGSKTVYDIFEINENQVIASGSSGQIYISNAAVDSFVTAADYGSMSMRAVEFRNDVGIVPASKGTIYRTTTAEWDTLYEVFTDPDGDDLYDVEFVNDTLVYVVGEAGKIYKSTDAGLTWAAEDSVTGETLQKVRFHNNTVWAVGQNATIVKLYISPTSIPEDNLNIIPQKYTLSQNYPNPFNPSTTIEFSLKHAGKVELAVFNVAGQKVETLVNKEMKAGQAKVEWNAGHLASGVYFYRLTSGDFATVKKLLLVK